MTIFSLLENGERPLAMLGASPHFRVASCLLHPLEEEILDVEIDDKEHEREDAGEADAGDGFENSLVGLTPEDSLVEQEDHVPTIENGDGQEVDDSKVDVDQSDQANEGHEVFGDDVRGVTEPKRSAEKVGIEVTHDQASKGEVDRGHGVPGVVHAEK